MGSSPLYLPLFPSLQRAHGRSAPQTHPSLILPTSSAAPPLTKPFGRSRRFVSGRYSKDPPKEPWLPINRDSPDGADENRSQFPLEYESVWDTKPPWCQPWTITLTGASVIASSWLVWHSVILTALIVPLIAAWWFIFLYSYPKAYSEMLAHGKKRVEDGAAAARGRV